MTAKEKLQEIINDINLESFPTFFRLLTERQGNFRESMNELNGYDDENFTTFQTIGEIIFQDNKLVIIGAKVSKDLSERSGKKNQYEKAKKILKDLDVYETGIFIYYDDSGNFRFSLIYPEFHGTQSKWNNFRRFTYYVSKELTNKTFLNRIGEGDFSSIETIKDAFSVKKVTDEFFKECGELFEKVKIEFEKTNQYTVCARLKSRYSDDEYKEQINKFAYLFLGRIIFIYFLLRKGWIENRSDYLRKVMEDESNINLYCGFLQPLFFEVFAKKESERSQEIKEAYKETPYLNGGLFERSTLENEMNDNNVIILFEDEFIRDLILNFFEIYNFTVDENSADDQEVSIDPEMLGKVFENSLAEEERGKKGTFYTPREIVHYMVYESLLRYLQNETGINQNTLHEFIYHEDFDFEKITKEHIRMIDEKLENVKIIDPAVGSAAFPVEMMHALVNLRKKLNVKVGRNINEVRLKKQIIKNNLYGVDIDPGAIEIAKLRLWLALVVDYKKNEVEALPNLDFQFRVGNSLMEKIDGLDIFRENNTGQLKLSGISEYEKVKNQMIAIKDEFYISEDEAIKKQLKHKFDDFEHKLIREVIKKYSEELSGHIRKVHQEGSEKKILFTSEKINRLEQQFKDGTYKLFKPDFHFSEAFDRKDKDGKKIGGFDIVIGNPPYGIKEDEEIKDWHELGSKDSYGIFIATALKRFLKPGGVLAYIVSDTWLTIKTHWPLRDQVLDKQLHKIIRLHKDCFDATVNACIMILSNIDGEIENLIAVDLTNISTRNEAVELKEKLFHLENFIGQATPKFAVYQYQQSLIKTNSNIPIFVGSPKLFALMNDTTCKTVEKVVGEKQTKKVNVRQIQLNGKTIEIVRLGDIAEIKQGLATADNDSYLFQNPGTRGSYRDITPLRKYLLSEKDLEKIRTNEKIREKVIEKGFHKSRDEVDFDEDLWFEGKYIVPYDKGGESDVEEGWLPNYYVPTNYFIDWSQWAVKRMKTLTIKDRNRFNGLTGGKDKVCSRFQNKEYYFINGITESRVGEYSPTFRRSIDTVFDSGCSNIFSIWDRDMLLGVECSKIYKWFIKLFINHTVNSQVDDLKEIPFCIKENDGLDIYVKKIIQAQEKNGQYDYLNNEQKEIDQLVYEMYGLNQEDIKEVETWYARRYPKLARFCNP